MNHNDNAITPIWDIPPGIWPHGRRPGGIMAGVKAPMAGLLAMAAMTNQALAQATPSTADIGQQVQNMAQVGLTTGVGFKRWLRC